MNQTYIGCSGFHYREWKGIFYPESLPQTKWFEYYCRHFNSLEINSSFYKVPTERSLINWYKTSPEGFKFSLKVPRMITHYKKFSDCKDLLTDFYTLLRCGLKDKSGCVLFQCPPQFVYTPHLLELILESVDPFFKNVFEFRNSGWWNEEVFRQFRSRGLIFSGISFPNLPDDVIKTSDDLYYRFHGVPVLYKSHYEDAFINKIYTQIKAVEPLESWIYFNNTWGTAGITNALHLQSLKL